MILKANANKMISFSMITPEIITYATEEQWYQRHFENQVQGKPWFLISLKSILGSGILRGYLTGKSCLDSNLKM